MLKSYFKTAFRFLLKNKTFSFINIIGLATGTLCCLYILLYVQDQYSYHKQHKNVQNLYRVTTDLVLTGDKHHGAASSPPIAPAMKADFPEVQNYVRVLKTDMLGAKQHLLRYKEQSFYETGAFYVDSTFFDMFTYHFVEGRAPHALDEPYSVVLLKPTADKLFGHENAVGKFISIDDAYGKHDFKVMGVVDESLGKSHLQGNIFISMKSGQTGNSIANDAIWGGNNFLYSYIKLRPDADPKVFESKLPAFLNKHGGQEMKSLELADVEQVNSADNYLSQFVMHDHGVYTAGGSMATATDAQNIATDQFFIKTYGIKLLSGRDFMPGDSNKVIINQTMAKRLNLNEQTAIGKRLYTQYGTHPVSFVTVAGVMKDFNYNSLHDDVRPFMLVYDNNPGDLATMVVATNSKDYKALLAQISTIWQKDLPSVPFEYSFLDSEVQKQYETEVVLSQIINSFTLMAILISCLGLFGLASFSAEQRQKEIGIRKVLGSSIKGIVWLLSKDFLQLIIFSFVIASLIAGYAMNKWLQAFAYRIPLSWWMFALAGLVAVFIALITVSFQAIKAALANPVKSLKSE